MTLIKKFFSLIKKIFVVKSKKNTRKHKKRVKKKVIAKKVISRTSNKIKKTTMQKLSHPVDAKKRIKPTKKKTGSEKVSIKSSRDEGFALGEITHYFNKICVCVIRIDQGMLKKGDRIRLESGSGTFEQVVSSMQIENEDVLSAKKGQLIGLKVKQAVSIGTKVFKIQKQ